MRRKASNPEKTMLAECLFGGIVAVLLWFLLSRKSKERNAGSLAEIPDVLDASVDRGTDVIIVGAGVAGSALAYTLGKVGF